MLDYLEQRILELESEIRVFGETEERLVKLEVFKRKLEEEMSAFDDIYDL